MEKFNDNDKHRINKTNVPLIGQVQWKFSSHGNFIAPNVSAADCYVPSPLAFH